MSTVITFDQEMDLIWVYICPSPFMKRTEFDGTVEAFVVGNGFIHIGESS